ncbi:uncharacterized protein LOC125676984 [Ostrea edulis]|uniref:uncharacterized protein LOC125676984 n=1 Tax=Ostrea edulis TaxID=37623 RepID=UPI0024AF882D|nr:uncharacterized protein LOC125676984 [Ostrea edulis]
MQVTFRRTGGNLMKMSTVGGENHFLNLQISQETSDWNDQVFSKLSVEMMPGVSTPYVVFSSFPDFLENQRHRRSKIIAMMNGDESLGERKVVVDCYKYAMEHIIDIDYEYIDHIPVYRVEKLYESTKTLDKTSMKNWIRHFANNDLHVMSGSKRIKERCKRVNQWVNDFLWQLLYMMNKKQSTDPEELSEGMFQELFLRFAKLFELKLVGTPNVGRYSFDIGGKEISSVPDAVVIDPGKQNSVLAAVKVSKCYSKWNVLETHTKLRKVSESHDPVEHVDCELKGQHLGGMLSVLCDSLFGPTGIFGFIVQATEVTIVAFATSENYLECIKTGNFPERDSATVRYSEKCNILTKKGRCELVRTFLDMVDLMEYL